MKKFLFGIFALCLCICLANVGAVEAADTAKAEFPVLITSLGQAPDGNTLSVLSKRAGAETTYETLAAPERVKDFKTVFVSFGVSLKGFGAAGVNLDTEIARGAEMIKTAKDNNVRLIGTHIGGAGRRDDMSNRIINEYAGQMSLLIVLNAGNEDGIFTKIAQENNIPLIAIEKPADIAKTLADLLK